MGLNSLSTIQFRMGFQAPGHIWGLTLITHHWPQPHIHHTLGSLTQTSCSKSLHSSKLHCQPSSETGSMDAMLSMYLQQPVSEKVFALLQWMVGKTLCEPLPRSHSFAFTSYSCLGYSLLFRVCHTSTEGLKSLSVEGLMQTCHHGMHGAMKIHLDPGYRNVSEITNTAMILDNLQNVGLVSGCWHLWTDWLVLAEITRKWNNPVILSEWATITPRVLDLGCI